MWHAHRRRHDSLAELNLPQIGNIRELAGAVSSRTGRGVHLEPASIGWTAPCGTCWVTKTAFYIFYDPRTSPMHQDHIIAHEFAHLLLGHYKINRLSAGRTSGLTSRIAPSTIEMMLGRRGYEVEEEHDAETLASNLQNKILTQTPQEGRPPADTVPARVARTLLRRGAS